MGIERLKPFIKDKAPSSMGPFPLTSLKGRKIAIDADSWMHTNMSVSRKKVINKTDMVIEAPDQREILKEWFSALFRFICRFLSYEIVPIFVFDGEPLPEKVETRKQRKEKTLSVSEKMSILRLEIDQSDILEVSTEKVVELRKLACQYNYIPPDDRDLIRKVLSDIGIPWLIAKHDAEKLCSMLCIEGRVGAVFSSDTDNIVYGCPLLLTKLCDPKYDEVTGSRIDQYSCVVYDRILKEMNVSHEFFVDLCIMGGCDYNTNIPGIALGKGMKLLEKHGSIDNLEDYYDITCLNHVRCREIFSSEKSFDLIVDGTMSITDHFTSVEKMLEIRELLEMIGVSEWLNTLRLLYRKLPQPKKPQITIVNK